MAKKRRRQPRPLRVTTSPRESWGLALEVESVVQSVSVPLSQTSAQGEPEPGPGGGYWGLMLPPGCPRRTLLLGLGGGTIAHLLARRCPDAEIVGVERDPNVLVVAREQFGLDMLPALTIVEADAFEWARERAEAGDEDFDLICMDLFEAGRLAPGALGTTFLRQIAALLAPDGILTVNLMVTGRTQEQLHRLRRVFRIVRELRLRGNLVVHAQSGPTESEVRDEDSGGAGAAQLS